MWFTPDQIFTDALNKVKECNKTTIEKELSEIISEEIAKFELNEICFTNQELLALIKDSGVRASRSQITYILRNKWALLPIENPSTYINYSYKYNDGKNQSTSEEIRKGRHYTFKKEMFIK